MISRPTALPVAPETIPALLGQQGRWVVWQYVEEVDAATGEVDYDKPPLRARDLGPASTTDPRTWSTLADALDAYHRHELDGVGLVLSPSDGDDDRLIGVDLDHCRNPATGEVEPWALDIVRRLNSYTEASPSGEGLRVFLLGRLPPEGRKRGNFECYEWGRYVTVTGQHLAGAPGTVEARPEAILEVHASFWPRKESVARPPSQPFAANGLADEDLLKLAAQSANGDKFRHLWEGQLNGHGSQSEADLALCNHLAFWCGPDEERIASLFARSGLFRAKWQREDYRKRTIGLALKDRTEFYQPPGTPAGRIAKPSRERRDADNSDDPLDQDATAFDLICQQSFIRWAWESWLQIGVLTILASEPGCGKTRFCADMARRVALGLPWPDGSAQTFPAGSPVLWVPADNQHPELGTLPTSFGFLPTLLYLNTTKREPFSGTMLDTPEDLKDFERRIARIKPAITFIDTSLNATDRTAHKPEDAKAFFKPLQEIAARQQAIIICVTHLNAAGKPLGRRIEGQGRVVLMLESPDPEGQPNRRKLWVKKSNSLYPPALGVTMGDGGNEYDLAPPQAPADEPGKKRGPSGEKLQKACDWLAKHLANGPARVRNTREAWELAGFSTGAMYAARDKLGVAEYREQDGLWWALTSSGMADE